MPACRKPWDENLKYSASSPAEDFEYVFNPSLYVQYYAMSRPSKITSSWLTKSDFHALYCMPIRRQVAVVLEASPTLGLWFTSPNAKVPMAGGYSTPSNPSYPLPIVYDPTSGNSIITIRDTTRSPTLQEAQRLQRPRSDQPRQVYCQSPRHQDTSCRCP